MTNTAGVLVIRADASSAIGTGHVMRCLALAQAWRDAGGRAVFVTCCQSPALRQRLVGESCEVVEIAEESDDAGWQVLERQLAAQQDAWVVLDGYHFDTAYQGRIRRGGHRLLVIDDMAHLPEYDADLILNQNLGADSLEYRCPAETRRLLGPRYALLRREFQAWRGWQRETPAVAKKVLVTMGGSDPDNVTAKVIGAIDGLELETRIVVGASNPHAATMQQQVRAPCTVVCDTSKMPELMAWADISVAAAGSTNWELLFMGLPSLVVALADNQLGIAHALNNHRLSEYMGWHTSVTSEGIRIAIQRLLADYQRRLDSSRSGKQIVDGHGASRVVATLRGA